MKQPLSKSPPASVPRLNSLLHRLQQAPGKEDSSRLDQLMIFLDDPPSGVADRWKEGAKMCSEWGIQCTGASVWRLHRSYALEWRLRVAQEADAGLGESAKSLGEKTEQMVTLRTYEVLANPQSRPECLLALARLEQRKQALALAEQKYQNDQKTRTQRAIDGLSFQVMFNPEAAFALDRLKELLKMKVDPRSYIHEGSPPPA